jgi:hypothetical protein
MPCHASLLAIQPMQQLIYSITRHKRKVFVFSLASIDPWFSTKQAGFQEKGPTSPPQAKTAATTDDD